MEALVKNTTNNFCSSFLVLINKRELELLEAQVRELSGLQTASYLSTNNNNSQNVYKEEREKKGKEEEYDFSGSIISKKKKKKEEKKEKEEKGLVKKNNVVQNDIGSSDSNQGSQELKSYEISEPDWVMDDNAQQNYQSMELEQGSGNFCNQNSTHSPPGGCGEVNFQQNLPDQTTVEKDHENVAGISFEKVFEHILPRYRKHFNTVKDYLTNNPKLQKRLERIGNVNEILINGLSRKKSRPIKSEKKFYKLLEKHPIIYLFNPNKVANNLGDLKKYYKL